MPGRLDMGGAVVQREGMAKTLVHGEDHMGNVSSFAADGLGFRVEGLGFRG